MTQSSDQKEAPIWVNPKSDPEWKQQIIKEFKIHPVTAQILVSRGFGTFESIHKYLYSKLPDLHDPFLFPEMPKAVDRICRAIKNQEKILIYGDNDVDGMTGTALLTEFLQYVGAEVIFFVSTPGTQRNSLIVESLDHALANDCKVLITVDCGITAAQEIAQIEKKGIDVIVTDHHEPTDHIPSCLAKLNPKLPDLSYPDRDLTGVGVAFKLAHGVTNQLSAEGRLPTKKIDLKRYLDLVALGTISDMGVLHGENRIFVRYGLLQLQKGKRIGLSKLVSICDLDVNDLNTFTVASKIAPRLNSLGRIADPHKGVELLLIRNSQAAERLAVELDLNNIERQKIERTMSEDVENLIKQCPHVVSDKAIVMASKNWHPGVIPIISARICKQYNRPTAIIAIDNNIGKGSLRSIPEFPLLPILTECADLLENFGGHDFAAGLSLKEQNIEPFKKRFTKLANKQLKEHDVKLKLELDAKIDFRDLTFECMESINLLEPFGNENPPPILITDATQAWPPKVLGKVGEQSSFKAHLKLFLEQDGNLFEAIAPFRGSDSSLLRKKDLMLRVAFTPQVDVFNKQSCIRLLVRDFQII